MPQSIRVYWGAVGGRAKKNFNWGAINVDSVVLVTACEYDPNREQSPNRSDYRFVGDAPIRVDDIAPHGPPSDPNKGVTFMIVVDWPTPLNVCTDITVFDDLPQEVQYVAGAPE